MRLRKIPGVLVAAAARAPHAKCQAACKDCAATENPATRHPSATASTAPLGACRMARRAGCCATSRYGLRGPCGGSSCDWPARCTLRARSSRAPSRRVPSHGPSRVGGLGGILLILAKSVWHRSAAPAHRGSGTTQQGASASEQSRPSPSRAAVAPVVRRSPEICI